LKKVAVVAKVGEGFIGNRIYAAYRRHCEFMVEDGASPEQVDRAIEAFGFAMGPFAVSDLSGLDIAWKMRQRLAATRDSRERYVDLADRLCEAGRLGRKTGAGWYTYTPESGRGQPAPETMRIIEASRVGSGRRQGNFSDEDIARRAVAAMVNEAALVLAEGIAQRPSDIDLTMVNGYRFPSHLGGPLFWAARQGREVLERAGLAIVESDLIGLELPEGPNPLLDVCTALLQAEVNIVQAYPLMIRPHGRPAVALMVDNLEMAQETLKSKGFTMITERDLVDEE
jgi:3-hydroxyacyl-CoA dehydrogenase